VKVSHTILTSIFSSLDMVSNRILPYKDQINAPIRCLQIKPNKYPRDFHDTFNEVLVNVLYRSSLLIFEFRRNHHTILRKFTNFLQKNSFKLTCGVLLLCHNTHISDIIPTTNRQWSIGLSYRFFHEQQQNFRIFPVFLGVEHTVTYAVCSTIHQGHFPHWQTSPHSARSQTVY